MSCKVERDAPAPRPRPARDSGPAAHRRRAAVPLVADAASAGLAALASLLVGFAILFAWRHFEEIESLFQVLMLLLLAGVLGILLSGDLFNLFVFLELASVPAYALTAYQARHAGPLQGAMNFAVTGSVGGLLFLLGVGLAYAHGGRLDLAGLGATLVDGPGPRVAFALLVAGFLVKAGAVPFHLAHADAHAVTPTPALHGAGRRLPVAGGVFLAAALGLLGLPPFATAWGKSALEEAAAGAPWIGVVLVVASG